MIPADSWAPEDFYLIAQRAYELHRQGQHDQALVLVSGLLAINPGNTYCLDAAAALSLALGRPDDAIQYASRVLRISPDHIDAIARRCEANIQLRRFQKVEDDLEFLKHTGREQLYRRIKMRLLAASGISVSASSAESLAHSATITGQIRSYHSHPNHNSTKEIDNASNKPNQQR
jgi:predicted Zn-dependent protease